MMMQEHSENQINIYGHPLRETACSSNLLWLKRDTWGASVLIAIGDAVYRSGKRAGRNEKRQQQQRRREQPGSVDDNQRRCRSQDGTGEVERETNRRRGREVEAS